MSELKDPADNQPTELQMLKSRADMMSIAYSNNIGVDALRKKIEAKMNGEEEQAEPKQDAAAGDIAPNPLAGETKPAKRKSLRDFLVEREMKLVRVRIQNLDPKKANLPGEIFTVANDHLGTVRKFIPYGDATEDGYHVPFILFKALQSRKFQNIRLIKDKRTGTSRVEHSWVKEFALEVLPQLTPNELNRLATAQIAAGTVDPNLA